MKKKITFSIIGVVGIILTIVCLLQDVGKLAETQYFGVFSSLLFLLSILSLGYGFFSEPDTKTIENKESEVTKNTMGID